VGAYTLDAGFGGATTHFAVKQNRVFKQKFRQNMPKTGYILEKKL